MSEIAAARRVAIPGVAMIAVTFGLARYGYGLLLPDMQAAVHIGAEEAGLIASSAYGSYLIANRATVWLTARFGVRLPIGMAAGLAATGMTLLGLASDTTGLACGVLLAGSAAGLAFPPYADVVARAMPVGLQATAWSAVSSGTGWGVALAGPVAIVMGSQWRAVWFVFALLAAVTGFFAVMRAPRGLTRPVAEPVRLDRRWFLCPRSRPLLTSALVVGVGSSAWWAFSVAAMRHAGLSPTTAIIVYAACGVSGVAASGLGALAARCELSSLYRVGVLVLMAALILLAVAPSQPVVALAAAVAFGLSYNSVIALQGLWSSRVFAERPSAGLAACNTALTVGTIVGPTLAGLIVHSSGYRSAFLLAAGVLGAALLTDPPRLAAHGPAFDATSFLDE